MPSLRKYFGKKQEVVPVNQEDKTLFLVRLQDESYYSWFHLPFGMLAARGLLRDKKIIRLQVLDSFRDQIDNILASAKLTQDAIEIEWVTNNIDSFDWQ